MADGGRTKMETFTPGPENAHAFRASLGRFATGVTVVTTMTDQGPLGMTVNSFASVSLDPPLVLWSPAKASLRTVHFTQAEHYAIHVLAHDQADLCQRFARDGDRFDGLDWTPCDLGRPLIEGCIARFECQTTAVHDGGDHYIILGQVTRATTREGTPLLFSRGKFGRFTASD